MALMLAEYVAMASIFAELVVCMASNYAESVVFMM